MGFLKRIFGSDTPKPDDRPAPSADELEQQERAHDVEAVRADQERLDDFRRQQIRYQEYKWEPPPQGGTRRADDGDEGGDAPS